MRLRPRGASAYEIVRRADGAVIGELTCRAGEPEDGWLTFGDVRVDPELQGLGLEAEAVRLMEGEAVQRGLADRFQAEVDMSHGLGLYFWLRLGYRPSGAASDGRDMIALIRGPGREG